MSKISELSDGGSLVSSDYLIAVRSGGNVKVRMDQINVDQVDLGDNEFIRLGNSQDLTMVHTSTQSIINQAGIGDLLIQRAGATKLTINASGIDVTGSVTATGIIEASDGTNGEMQFGLGTALTTGAGTYDSSVRWNGSAGNLLFSQGAVEKMRITSTGIDVTGTVTADGLTVSGTGDRNIAVESTNTGAGANAGIKILAADGGDFLWQTGNATGNALRLYDLNANQERLRIDASGNVGIGTTSPASYYSVPLVVATSGSQGGITIANTTANQQGMLAFADGTSGSDRYSGYIDYNHNTNVMSFGTNGGVERMRIDASGNVGIGTVPNSWGSTYEALSVGPWSTLGTFSNADGGFLVGNAYHDGTNWKYRNNGTAEQYKFLYGAHVWEYAASGTAGDTISFSEAMRIDASGNVGIGVVPSAAYKMQVNVATNTVSTGSPVASSLFNIGGGTTTVGDGVSLQLSNSSGAKETAWRISAVTASGNNGDLVFNGYAGGADYPERMRIDSLGRPFIPGAYDYTTAAAANMYVASGGQFFRSTSSERYKNTIQDATHGLAELLTLRPVTYKGNDDGDIVFGGLIAEEVHAAGLTEFVQYNDDNEPDALAYANMVSLCIKSIQEQQATIEALTARIAALES